MSSKSADLDIVKLFETEVKRIEKTLDNIYQFYRKDFHWLDKISDHIAEVGGSWRFIGSFLLILFIWVMLNSYLLTTAFDPYPYQLLNVILACVASLQAPFILMAQNRSTKRDQTRIELNLEKDLRDLKIDQESHKLLLKLHKDIEEIKKKIK